jgi:IS30 family transposase
MMEFSITSSIRNNSVMVKSSTNQEKYYTHLSLAEREEIAVALEQGRSMPSIALSLGRSPSSVSREIQRNTPNKVKYRGNRAQKWAEDRSLRTTRRNLWSIPWSKPMWNTFWTPQSIAGRLSLISPN